MCSTGDAATVFDEKTYRARKTYRCDECGAPIPPGVRYIRIGVLNDGYWDTLRTHFECRVLWGAVHNDLCQGHGLIMIGGLDQELSDYGVNDAQTDEELTEEWDGEVPAEVLQAMPYRRRFEAIREMYRATPGGDERAMTTRGGRRERTGL